MINRYTKVITYRDIASLTQEYDQARDSKTLILETVDGGRLVFHKYKDINQDCIFYEQQTQQNLEYDEVWEVVKQYLQYAALIQRDLKFPNDARKLVEGE